MKEKIYELLKDRSSKRIISGISAQDVNYRLFSGKESTEKIFNMLNELAEDNQAIEVYQHAGKEDRYDGTRFWLNNRKQT